VSDDFDEPGERTAVLDRAALMSLAPAARMRRHVLVRMDNAGVGQIITLTKETHSVGRLPDNDIHLSSDGMSRRHARLIMADGSFVLEDLDSANGTFVAGVRIKRQALRDGDVIQFGPLAAYRYSVTDAHEEKMLRHLYEASVKDSLTGAYNREYLSERLKSEIAYANRHGTELSLILLDLDHFKNVNDTYGHQAGDAVLIDLSRHLASVLRAEDIFARYGGEEFAVTLRGIALDGAERVGDRLREAVQANPIVFDRHAIACTISVGCASLASCPEKSRDHLIAAADRRLYAAKRGGRNRVVAHD
jgi:two-component system cell cycle response regulator